MKTSQDPYLRSLKKRLEELKTCVPLNATSPSARPFGSFLLYMCRNYHLERTFSSFVTLWNDFIKRKSHVQPKPIFYQEVTDTVFEGIIASALPVRAAIAAEAAIIT